MVGPAPLTHTGTTVAGYNDNDVDRRNQDATLAGHDGDGKDDGRRHPQQWPEHARRLHDVVRDPVPTDPPQPEPGSDDPE